MRYLALLTLLACANKAPTNPPPSATPPPPPDPQTDSRTVPLTESPAPTAKAPGNLPVMTESELAERDARREKCVEDCVKSRQMQAVPVETIQQQCQNECLIKIPIEQVEVIPEDAPMFESP